MRYYAVQYRPPRIVHGPDTYEACRAYKQVVVGENHLHLRLGDFDKARASHPDMGPIASLAPRLARIARAHLTHSSTLHEVFGTSLTHEIARRVSARVCDADARVIRDRRRTRARGERLVHEDFERGVHCARAGDVIYAGVPRFDFDDHDRLRLATSTHAAHARGAYVLVTIEARAFVRQVFHWASVEQVGRWLIITSPD